MLLKSKGILDLQFRCFSTPLKKGNKGNSLPTSLSFVSHIHVQTEAEFATRVESLRFIRKILDL